MRRFTIALAMALGALGAASVVDAARTLDIYFIDVEGGQATLIVTPSGESLLVDSGFPSSGTFDSVPGDPATARDANRIVAAARTAGVKRIDYFFNTHFHADHDGGIVELAQLMPIRMFIDHGSPAPNVDESSPGSMAQFERYAAVRAKGRHLDPNPGDRLPIKGLEITVVSAKGTTITKPLAGAGATTRTCPSMAPDAEEKNENPRSTGFRLRYGAFSFLDVGDLSGSPLHALACPVSLIGPVSIYLVTHHGGPDARHPSTFEAFAPHVAIVNDGPRKGGVKATLEAMASVSPMEVWQLHRRPDAGEANVAEERIANLDESTAHWIKVSASQNGSFSVTNGRTGATNTYQ